MKTDVFKRIATESAQEEMDIELLGARGLPSTGSESCPPKSRPSPALLKLQRPMTNVLQGTRGDGYDGGGSDDGSRGDDGGSVAVANRKREYQRTGEQEYGLTSDGERGAATTGRVGASGGNVSNRHGESSVNSVSKDGGARRIHRRGEEAGSSEEHLSHDHGGHFIRRAAAAATVKGRQATVVPQ